MYQHTRLTNNNFTFFQKFRNFDYILLICILLLGFISLATMYSTDGGKILFHTKSHFTKLMVFTMMMLFISFINIKFWFSIGYLSYIVVVSLLVWTYFFGITSSGSKRWMDLYFINLQPSELMKIFIILCLAKYFHRMKQSKIAVGSGGIFGKGFLKGTQSYLEFLPEKHTDFIFTLFSEEFGFVGSVVLLVIYIIIIYRIIAIGANSRSYFAKLFCYGFGAAIFVFITINMSMVLGLLPIVGSPLPIMSYGGSSMLATMIGFGIVMSARVHSQQLIA